MLHTNHPNCEALNHRSYFIITPRGCGPSEAARVRWGVSPSLAHWPADLGRLQGRVPQCPHTLWSLQHGAASGVAGLLRQLPGACSQHPQVADRVKHPALSSLVSEVLQYMSHQVPFVKRKGHHNRCRRLSQPVAAYCQVWHLGTLKGRTRKSMGLGW